MRVTEVTFFFREAREFLEHAKQKRLTGQVRLNMKDGAVCGGGHFTVKNGVDMEIAQGVSFSDRTHPRSENGRGDALRPSASRPPGRPAL